VGALQHCAGVTEPTHTWTIRLQVSDKERKSDYDNLFKDIATLLSEKCVNPDTNRPYTITMLERALKDIHFNVDVKKNAKQLMLEVCTAACRSGSTPAVICNPAAAGCC
jgi:hypothetical protein